MGKKLILVVLGVLVGLVIWAGGRDGRTEPLTLVVIPADDPGPTREGFAPLVFYLSEGLGREVRLLLVSDYAAVVEALKYGHADIARIGATGYVQAIDQGAEIEPIAVGVKKSTGFPGYYGCIIARADRDWEDDLNGKSFAFVDPGSTSGYVVSSVYLEQEGIKLEETFMAGSHPAVILAVKNGTVDAGATATHRLDVAIDEGIISPGEIEILWLSPLIPNPPIVVQSSMDKTTKDGLRDLFLAAPESIVEVQGIKEIGYVEASDSDYDSIREILAFKSR